MDKTLISKKITVETPTLIIINPDDIKEVWIEVKPLIEKALVHAEGELRSEDILQLTLESKQTLWVGLKNKNIFCAGVTEIISYPRKRVLRIITFATKNGHDYKHWKDFEKVLESYGARHRCSSLKAWTRKGLARKLKWNNEYSVITKDIESKWQ